ncbi:MAG TPA: HAMP domain-containing sensor histidine kinase [Acidimicrobiales bacterium]|nr:HAMP domain-containing sensor histidine kinase [Acidimicrobiales bacterium]
MAVAVVLACVTYALTTRYLVDQRERSAQRQTWVNARLARAVLRSPDPDVSGLLGGLGGGTASSSLLRYQGEWFATAVAPEPDALPKDLVREVSGGRAGLQRYRDAKGDLRLAVGTPLAAAGADYYELFELDELERNLDLLARALAVGVIAAAVAAAAVGRAAAGRLLRPLDPVIGAAHRISEGELDARLDDVDDPDLQTLALAFNTMAGALEARVEREARFAADVSHELRSPLTAVAAAVEIIDRRRDQLPPQVLEAFVVLSEKVAGFQQMVLDLLEISRVDADTATLSEDLIDLHHFVPRLLDRGGASDAAVSFSDAAPGTMVGDRRRLAQVLGNLIDNAGRYAGGVTAIAIDRAESDVVRISIDDEGPGVPIEERDAIFGRFARGQAGIGAGTSSGSGLGLSLVVEHLRLHGGRVWVEERPGGGARFVVEVPEAPR